MMLEILTLRDELSSIEEESTLMRMIRILPTACFKIPFPFKERIEAVTAVCERMKFLAQTDQISSNPMYHGKRQNGGSGSAVPQGKKRLSARNCGNNVARREERKKQKNKEIADLSDKTCHVTSRNDALFEIAHYRNFYHLSYYNSNVNRRMYVLLSSHEPLNPETAKSTKRWKIMQGIDSAW
ncbi:hypothetical protein AVEN_103343-1 [Araneus ventricosus]|uniref:Uncharacterized protein n=1 Tax=Araneus ventricosus TaxID=182803 RepID=A0A4Y2KBS5_ARAVE|nr:hypothetical protein AVEN_103343-1 [Araneus ventricosus]